MSKSDGANSSIFLLDDADTILKIQKSRYRFAELKSLTRARPAIKSADDLITGKTAENETNFAKARSYGHFKTEPPKPSSNHKPFQATLKIIPTKN